MNTLQETLRLQGSIAGRIGYTNVNAVNWCIDKPIYVYIIDIYIYIYQLSIQFPSVISDKQDFAIDKNCESISQSPNLCSP